MTGCFVLSLIVVLTVVDAYQLSPSALRGRGWSALSRRLEELSRRQPAAVLFQEAEETVADSATDTETETAPSSSPKPFGIKSYPLERRCFIAGFGPFVKEEELIEHFNTFFGSEEVEDLKIFRHRDGESKNCGVVAFKDADTQKRAVAEMKNSPMKGGIQLIVMPDSDTATKASRFVQLEEGQRIRQTITFRDGRKMMYEVFQTAEDRKRLVLSGLPYEMSEDGVDALIEALGMQAPVEVVEIKNKAGESRGQRFLTYDNAGDASEALAKGLKALEEGKGVQEAGGRPIRLRQCTSRVPVDRRPSAGEDRKFNSPVTGGGTDKQYLYIRNLPWQTTEQELGYFLSEMASIEWLKLNMNENQRFTGTAIVKFTDEIGAQTILKTMNGTVFGGRPIVIDYARRRSQAPGAAPSQNISNVARQAEQVAAAMAGEDY
uniref:RRM domain-containing protein n=1 Tax=Chromera velia CCMP2878 TaxID=1169474 RepID=A0A0G4HDG5_9ALVE|eukprot:Cvel_26512.t1-p1 / transcript=Cvel_26512.t1 / gene=Cvel_26512 / organism=Chromera_velia_CCMP2878 / gene_product=Nucleolin, putative / transcript_product=Nucleolin, putative / location=Cvel_scaffold3164:6724-13800(-) / protein_length=433 / sequence_SO=supercontig / SO=protein_coding / is_pseudo=false